MKRARIVVADRQRIFRAGVQNLLAGESGLSALEVGTLAELLRVVDVVSPDVALIDLDLPTLGGVAAARAVAERGATLAIVWSLQPTREAVLAALRAGAHGFLRKEISPDGLVRAVRGALQGQAPISRDLAWLVVEALHDLEERLRASGRARVLSVREREVLDLVSRGASNKQIAASLGISEFTVKRHVQNILDKLEVPSRRAAATFYRIAFDLDLSGLGEPGTPEDLPAAVALDGDETVGPVLGSADGDRSADTTSRRSVPSRLAEVSSR